MCRKRSRKKVMVIATILFCMTLAVACGTKDSEKDPSEMASTTPSPTITPMVSASPNHDFLDEPGLYDDDDNEWNSSYDPDVSSDYDKYPDVNDVTAGDMQESAGIASDAADMLDDLGNNVGNGIRDLGDGIGDMIEDAGDGIGNAIEDAGNGMNNAMDELTGKPTAKPAAQSTTKPSTRSITQSTIKPTATPAVGRKMR